MDARISALPAACHARLPVIVIRTRARWSSACPRGSPSGPPRSPSRASSRPCRPCGPSGPCRAPVQAPPPAGPVPVPTVADASIHPERLRGGGPGDDVRRAGRYLLVAARAAVGLRRRRAGHRADHPVAVRPRLDLLDGIGQRLARLTADPARAHGPASSARAPPQPLIVTHILCGHPGTARAMVHDSPVRMRPGPAQRRVTTDPALLSTRACRARSRPSRRAILRYEGRRRGRHPRGRNRERICRHEQWGERLWLISLRASGPVPDLGLYSAASHYGEQRPKCGMRPTSGGKSTCGRESQLRATASPAGYPGRGDHRHAARRRAGPGQEPAARAPRRPYHQTFGPGLRAARASHHLARM